MARKTNETTQNANNTKTESKNAGKLVIKAGESVLFSKTVWKESTAKDKVNNDINDLCLTDQEKAIEVLSKMLASGKLTIEIELEKPADTDSSLEDFM